MPAGQPLSLLWPEGTRGAPASRLDDQAVADLHLDDIVRAIVSAGTPAGRVAARERFAHEVLTTLICQPAIIAYRQAVVTDLVDNPSLRKRLEGVLPALEVLGDVPRGERYRPTAEPGLERVARRLADLELLIDVVSRLNEALGQAPLTSPGLRALSVQLQDLRHAPEFAALERELPALRAKLDSVRSVTIGVNLGPDLSPESATILELGATPIQGRRGLLWRLLGGGASDHGLTPLQRGEGGPLGRPNELVRDLRHLLGQVVAPVAVALERFHRVSTDAVAQLGGELALLLGAARLGPHRAKPRRQDHLHARGRPGPGALPGGPVRARPIGPPESGGRDLYALPDTRGEPPRLRPAGPGGRAARGHLPECDTPQPHPAQRSARGHERAGSPGPGARSGARPEAARRAGDLRHASARAGQQRGRDQCHDAGGRDRGQSARPLRVRRRRRAGRRPVRPPPHVPDRAARAARRQLRGGDRRTARHQLRPARPPAARAPPRLTRAGGPGP